MNVHTSAVRLELREAVKLPEQDHTATGGSPHSKPAETVVLELGSDATRGLPRAEAKRRLDRYGPNELKSAPETPWWKRLLEQFENFLVIILLVAIVISVIEWLLQDPRESALPYEAIVISLIVVLNAMLGYVQESRAEKSVRALMALAAPEATVVRDGERQRVPAREIVPGDIVLVEAGDKIPADARIIEDANLHTDEAPLTGESMPVTKNPRPLGGDIGLGDRLNMLFAGTVATYGRGRAVVVATGMQTEVGKIAGLLEAAEKEPTPLQQELDRTGKRLTVVMLGICAVVFAAGLFSAKAFTLNVVLSMFLFAVALAVAAIPEALPAIVTIGLSLGVRRMAAAHAIVRKLPAIETLGAATVICSDKTGTLTRNEMTVRAIFCAGSVVEVGGSGYIPEGAFTCDGKSACAEGPIRSAVEQTLMAASLVNDAALTNNEGRWSVQGDPTEGALVVAARKFGITEDVARQASAHCGNSIHVRTEAAHDRSRRPGEADRAADHGEGRAGSPAAALPLRHAARSVDRAQREGAGRHREAQRRPRRPGAARARDRDPQHAGHHVGHRSQDGRIRHRAAGNGRGGAGLPRPDWNDRSATSGGEGCRRRCTLAHIRTVMITGDHPATAAAIARELNILEQGSRIVTGTELRTMDDAQLDAIVDDVRVFARVDPDHKLRIVQSLQRKGHIAAMTGDGINDAPALKTANVGIAMGITGTDVSKEAADIVLTDDNFASIVKAIEEGRGVYDNIQKYLLYLLSTNSGELMTMFAGVMFATWLGLISADLGLFLPLLAAQLLWINLVTDGPPALALGVDPKDREVMKRAPRRHGSGILLNEDWVRLACVGLLMMVGTVAVLDAYYPGGMFTLFATGTAPNAFDEAHARTMAFTTLMMYQLFDVYNCRSRRRSAFNGFLENKWLLVAIAFALGHSRSGGLRAVPAGGIPYGGALRA